MSSPAISSRSGSTPLAHDLPDQTSALVSNAATARAAHDGFEHPCPPPNPADAEERNSWNYDEGFFRPAITYTTDKSVDDAYGALEDSILDDGHIDTHELMKYIMSGFDHTQYTEREARQIANAIRVHWNSMTPEARTLGTRFIEEMRERVPDIDDCSPYKLAGMDRSFIFEGPRHLAPERVVMTGGELTQFLGELAALSGGDVRG